MVNPKHYDPVEEEEDQRKDEEAFGTWGQQPREPQQQENSDG